MASCLHGSASSNATSAVQLQNVQPKGVQSFVPSVITIFRHSSTNGVTTTGFEGVILAMSICDEAHSLQLGNCPSCESETGVLLQ
eukprot:6106058-Amphidinium_carterae.2